MRELIGTGVALITPFNQDLSIDTDSLKRVVNHCIDGGVDYLVVLGTTGESVTLSKPEKKLVAETVIEANGGRLPLVIGIGGNNTTQLVQELQDSDLSEFTAVLSVSPYYNKPSQEGIYRHFKALAEASPIPLVLYNVPGRTGSNISPDTAVRLAGDMENIVAIKEASADLSQIANLIQKKPDDFLVISGDDFTALSTVFLGGSGVISVIGQAFPEEFCTMIKEGRMGKKEAAERIQDQLIPAIKLIFEEGSPSGIKVIMEILGLSNANVRLPLVEATADLKARIAHYISSFSGIHA